MFCRKCGAKLPDGVPFCSNCGTPTAVTPSAPMAAPTAVVPPAAPVMPVPPTAPVPEPIAPVETPVAPAEEPAPEAAPAPAAEPAPEAAPAPAAEPAPEAAPAPAAEPAPEAAPAPAAEPAPTASDPASFFTAPPMARDQQPLNGAEAPRPAAPAQPGYNPPVGTYPNYTQPNAPERWSNPGQPVYAPPGNPYYYGQPTQPGQAAYGQPTQPGQPAYGQPPYQQPGQPAYSQPLYQQPGANPYRMQQTATYGQQPPAKPVEPPAKKRKLSTGGVVLALLAALLMLGAAICSFFGAIHFDLAAQTPGGASEFVASRDLSLLQLKSALGMPQLLLLIGLLVAFGIAVILLLLGALGAMRGKLPFVFAVIFGLIGLGCFAASFFLAVKASTGDCTKLWSAVIDDQNALDGWMRYINNTTLAESARPVPYTTTMPGLFGWGQIGAGALGTLLSLVLIFVAPKKKARAKA